MEMTGDLFIDFLGEFFWYQIFLMPIIMILISMRFKSLSWISRLFVGLFLGLIFSIVFYYLCLEILFRNGMGP